MPYYETNTSKYGMGFDEIIYPEKQMADWCVGCTCPKDFPICVCGNKPKAELVTKKPVEPSEEELAQNNRARSAKLRICKKL